MNNQLVEHCVEVLCNQGCQSVWRNIEVIEAGEKPDAMDGLSGEECEQVLEELKSIMAVYDAAGSCTFD